MKTVQGGFRQSISILFFLWGISVYSAPAAAVETDTAVAEKLKDELNLNKNRRSGFKDFKTQQKKFEVERDRGLAEFLEEDEKFALQREKGLWEYKKSKTSEMTEDGPEFKADLQEKNKRVKEMETARQLHVKTRDQIKAEFNHGELVDEEIELGLIAERPRYDQRKRSRNKWVKSGSQSSSSGSGFTGSFPSNPLDGNFNAGPTQDFVPQPLDNFEEIPPPPPPVPYEEFGTAGAGQSGFDSGFGEAPLPPPPPPPPDGGWDF